jgi:3-oxoacyl-[acyl-carrier-protein] synthase-3
MTRLGIGAIGSYVPETRILLAEIGERFDASPEFIRDKLGFRSLAARSDQDETSDLCFKACRDLRQSSGVELAGVECLVVITQNPDAHGLPHTSAILHERLGLGPDVACFDVSLGCSGFVHGLGIIEGFMANQGMTRGLLFTADPYTKVIDRDDRNTALLFGDGATCTLIDDQPRFWMGRAVYATSGRDHRAIRVDAHSRKLRMDGNQVFRFVTRTVPGQIQKCLQTNVCPIDEVDLFLLHQGSKYIVDTVATSMRLPREKVPFAAQETGNTVSSSIPMMLKTVLASHDAPARTIVLCGFGVGLSCATTLIRSAP